MVVPPARHAVDASALGLVALLVGLGVLVPLLAPIPEPLHGENVRLYVAEVVVAVVVPLPVPLFLLPMKALRYVLVGVTALLPVLCGTGRPTVGLSGAVSYSAQAWQKVVATPPAKVEQFQSLG